MSELKEFIIGVDVSKKTLEIAILEKATQKVVGTKSFSNAPKGFSEMILYVGIFRKYPTNCLPES